MRVMTMFLLAGLAAPGFADAMDCPAANPAQPLRPAVLAPVASELAMSAPLGTPSGVLSQAYDESQSVEQVLLRIRIESCRNVASVIPSPVPGVVNPDNPAAYKPRTPFDNTPWRFNMNQNGKNMTADEFSAWMKSRGVRVARGANSPTGGAAVPMATTSSQPWVSSPPAPVPAAATGTPPVPATTPLLPVLTPVPDNPTRP